MEVPNEIVLKLKIRTEAQKKRLLVRAQLFPEQACTVRLQEADRRLLTVPRPNPNWKPNPTPNPQKNQTNQFSRQPQNQGPSSFQNHPKPSFSVQKPIQPPRPASTQAVPMSWRTSNPNFHNMETGQETGNELENPGDNETENQIEYDQNYASDQEHFLGDTGLPQEFPDSN
ncbi:unnamed protein product [Nesidiocoris tenuis]|uniref:Uncharacterized protein n=1 Tax=Nesidiocoris tenuis TaxID=355587 RepID=A0A6H5GJ17_9HEMI|nr:unnamed protein product [Nesidiocoris tenuis]